jgi:hypothetical protein
MSFEAGPLVHPSLRERVRRSSGGAVTVIEKVVGAEPGTARFYANPNRSDWGMLASDFGTIEVEVGELNVLRGAEKTFATRQPLLLFELNPFCLWRYGRTLPQGFCEWVRKRFPYMIAIDDFGNVTPLDNEQVVNEILFSLGTTGGLVDVLASAEPTHLVTKSLRRFVPA